MSSGPPLSLVNFKVFERNVHNLLLPFIGHKYYHNALSRMDETVSSFIKDVLEHFTISEQYRQDTVAAKSKAKQMVRDRQLMDLELFKVREENRSKELEILTLQKQLQRRTDEIGQAKENYYRSLLILREIVVQHGIHPDLLMEYYIDEEDQQQAEKEALQNQQQVRDDIENGDDNESDGQIDWKMRASVMKRRTAKIMTALKSKLRIQTHRFENDINHCLSQLGTKLDRLTQQKHSWFFTVQRLTRVISSQKETIKSLHAKLKLHQDSASAIESTSASSSRPSSSIVDSTIFSSSSLTSKTVSSPKFMNKRDSNSIKNSNMMDTRDKNKEAQNMQQPSLNHGQNEGDSSGGTPSLYEEKKQKYASNPALSQYEVNNGRREPEFDSKSGRILSSAEMEDNDGRAALNQLSKSQSTMNALSRAFQDGFCSITSTNQELGELLPTIDGEEMNRNTCSSSNKVIKQAPFDDVASRSTENDNNSQDKDLESKQQNSNTGQANSRKVADLQVQIQVLTKRLTELQDTHDKMKHFMARASKQVDQAIPDHDSDSTAINSARDSSSLSCSSQISPDGERTQRLELLIGHTPRRDSNNTDLNACQPPEPTANNDQNYSHDHDNDVDDDPIPDIPGATDAVTVEPSTTTSVDGWQTGDSVHIDVNSHHKHIDHPGTQVNLMTNTGHLDSTYNSSVLDESAYFLRGSSTKEATDKSINETSLCRDSHAVASSHQETLSSTTSKEQSVVGYSTPVIQKKSGAASTIDVAVPPALSMLDGSKQCCIVTAGLAQNEAQAEEIPTNNLFHANHLTAARNKSTSDFFNKQDFISMIEHLHAQVQRVKGCEHFVRKENAIATRRRQQVEQILRDVTSLCSRKTSKKLSRKSISDEFSSSAFLPLGISGNQRSKSSSSSSSSKLQSADLSLDLASPQVRALFSFKHHRLAMREKPDHQYSANTKNFHRPPWFNLPSQLPTSKRNKGTKGNRYKKRHAMRQKVSQAQMNMKDDAHIKVVQKQMAAWSTVVSEPLDQQDTFHFPFSNLITRNADDYDENVVVPPFNEEVYDEQDRKYNQYDSKVSKPARNEGVGGTFDYDNDDDDDDDTARGLRAREAARILQLGLSSSRSTAVAGNTDKAEQETRALKAGDGLNTHMRRTSNTASKRKIKIMKMVKMQSVQTMADQNSEENGENAPKRPQGSGRLHTLSGSRQAKLQKKLTSSPAIKSLKKASSQSTSRRKLMIMKQLKKQALQELHDNNYEHLKMAKEKVIQTKTSPSLRLDRAPIRNRLLKQMKKQHLQQMHDSEASQNQASDVIQTSHSSLQDCGDNLGIYDQSRQKANSQTAHFVDPSDLDLTYPSDRMDHNGCAVGSRSLTNAAAKSLTIWTDGVQKVEKKKKFRRKSKTMPKAKPKLEPKPKKPKSRNTKVKRKKTSDRSTQKRRMTNHEKKKYLSKQKQEGSERRRKELKAKYGGSDEEIDNELDPAKIGAPLIHFDPDEDLEHSRIASPISPLSLVPPSSSSPSAFRPKRSPTGKSSNTFNFLTKKIQQNGKNDVHGVSQAEQSLFIKDLLNLPSEDRDKTQRTPQPTADKLVITDDRYNVDGLFGNIRDIDAIIEKEINEEQQRKEKEKERLWLEERSDEDIDTDKKSNQTVDGEATDDDYDNDALESLKSMARKRKLRSSSKSFFRMLPPARSAAKKLSGVIRSISAGTSHKTRQE